MNVVYAGASYVTDSDYSIVINDEGVFCLGNDLRSSNVDGQLGLGTKVFTSCEQVQDIPYMKAVTGTSDSSFLLDIEGFVWSCGNNRCGKLGFYDERNRQFFTKIPDLPPIVDVACDPTSAMFLDLQGNIWGCGFGCPLGLGATSVTLKITQVPNLPPIQSIAMGRRYSLLLDESNKVWSCGENSKGQLALGDSILRARFTPVLSLPPISQISCGSLHCTLLSQDSSVWTCGESTFYSNAKCVPQNVPGLPPIHAIFNGFNRSMFIDEEANVWTKAVRAGLTPEKIKGLPPTRTISCGQNHTIFVEDTGSLCIINETTNKVQSVPTLKASIPNSSTKSARKL